MFLDATGWGRGEFVLKPDSRIEKVVAAQYLDPCCCAMLIRARNRHVNPKIIMAHRTRIPMSHIIFLIIEPHCCADTFESFDSAPVNPPGLVFMFPPAWDYYANL